MILFDARKSKIFFEEFTQIQWIALEKNAKRKKKFEREEEKRYQNKMLKGREKFKLQNV